MTKKPKPGKHPGRGGNNISLAPLTLDQALGAALRVKPSDVKKLAAKEAAAKKTKRKKK